MPLRFGSAAWSDALRDALNASSEYRNAAAKWGQGFDGSLVLAFEQGGGLPAPLHLHLDLAAGRCDRAAFVEAASRPPAGFVLRAPFPVWREILERRLLAATAILTGKMKVEGDTITLLRHAGAHRALLHVTASLDTEFPA
jgi:putative sterol carrier protein